MTKPGAHTSADMNEVLQYWEECGDGGGATIARIWKGSPACCVVEYVGEGMRYVRRPLYRRRLRRDESILACRRISVEGRADPAYARPQGHHTQDHLRGGLRRGRGAQAAARSHGARPRVRRLRHLATGHRPLPDTGKRPAAMPPGRHPPGAGFPL